jgi:hypothetical protein
LDGRLAAEGMGETPDSVARLSPFTKEGRRLMAEVTTDGLRRAWQQMGLPPWKKGCTAVLWSLESPAISMRTTQDAGTLVR